MGNSSLVIVVDGLDFIFFYFYKKNFVAESGRNFILLPFSPHHITIVVSSLFYARVYY